MNQEYLILDNISVSADSECFSDDVTFKSTVSQNEFQKSWDDCVDWTTPALSIVPVNISKEIENVPDNKKNIPTSTTVTTEVLKYQDSKYNVVCGKFFLKNDKNIKLRCFNLFKKFKYIKCINNELCDNCLKRKRKIVNNYYMHNNCNEFKNTLIYYFNDRFKFVNFNILTYYASPYVELSLRRYVTTIYFDDKLDYEHLKWMNHLKSLCYPTEEYKFCNNFWHDIIYQTILIQLRYDNISVISKYLDVHINYVNYYNYIDDVYYYNDVTAKNIYDVLNIDV